MAPLIGAALSIGSKLIDKFFPDPEEKAKAKLKLMELEQSGELKELDAQMQTIVAEAKSEHVITATWRPITMLVFVTIVANNYIIYPYLTLFWSHAPILQIPPDLWDLLKIGIGGYVGGRSIEKAAKAWKGK